MSETRQLTIADREEVFKAAYNGSYYTILGCGGDLNEWTTGYKELLEKRGIGTPKEYISFKGADMNEVYGLTGTNGYDEGLTFLMFPLDNLDAGKLAMFRLQAGDKWFDDIVDNNQRRQEAING